MVGGDSKKRFALPNSRIMMHQPSGGYQGQVTDIEIQTKEIIKTKKRLNEIYAKHSGNDIKEGKINLPLLYALNTMSKYEKNRVYSILRKKRNTQLEIMKWMVSIKVKNYLNGV